jgi:outer membrane protein OmpA-like peptidoglycan-associated protein
MRRVSVLAAVGAAAVVALDGHGARAQGLDGERFVPAAGAAGGLQLERPVVPAHLGYGLGLFLNVADDGVVARDQVSGDTVARPLDHAFSADLLASLGLFDHFELAVHLPLRLIYSGDAITSNGTTLEAAAGVGDVRLVPKVGLGWVGDVKGGFAFGLAVPVSLPTGRASALRGAGAVTVEPRLLGLAYGERWFLNGSVGFRLREVDGPGAPGNELTFGVAGTYTLPVEDDALEVQVEAVAGWLPDEDGRAMSALPLELLAALVYRPAPRWSLIAGGGLGVTNAVAVPDFRVLAGVRYAVGVPGRGGQKDSDTDGVPDRQDRCPREPEDLDGFRDSDGCPEQDNDGDGIADDDDECPDDAEEPGGDRDGCPDRPRVVVRKGKMTVYGKVLFPIESASMLPRSEPLIDELARALREHPRIRRIEIAGHTDNTGRAAYNRSLSQERAETVKRSLVKRGIASQRLVTRGYGEDAPVAPNVTRAGRAKNRRVDFNILDD